MVRLPATQANMGGMIRLWRSKVYYVNHIAFSTHLVGTDLAASGIESLCFLGIAIPLYHMANQLQSERSPARRMGECQRKMDKLKALIDGLDKRLHHYARLHDYPPHLPLNQYINAGELKSARNTSDDVMTATELRTRWLMYAPLAIYCTFGF
jgi:hypothetical protein